MRNSPLPPIRPDDLLPVWQVLCSQIGQRIAGTDDEHRAARYLADEFRSAGLSDVRLEAFDCNSLQSAAAELLIRSGPSWQDVPCEVLVGSPSTASAKLTELDLLWVEMPEQATLLKPGSMKGKALGIFGPLATNTAHHRAIVKTGAAIVLWVDDRMPFPYAKADGILPAWARRHGALPTIGVPYRTAYEWRLRGLTRIRARVLTRHVKADSHNVIGDLAGADPSLGSIVFGCHYDTQVGNVGADDNASGAVAVVALARLFATAARNQAFARTMRFIAFGAEEQLSVGSRAYCLTNLRNKKGTAGVLVPPAIMVNFDSISSALGHTELILAGSDNMERWTKSRLDRNGLSVRITREVNPFSDHFPFTAFGVPAVWFCRPNCPGGRWQHHCIHDTLENCSPEVTCTILNSLVPVVAALANARQLPFNPDFNREQRKLIHQYARELYDMRP